MLTTRSFETRLRKLERKHRSPIDDVSALSDEELDAALRAVYRQLIAEHGGVEAAEAALRADLGDQLADDFLDAVVRDGLC